ncbi:MAG: amidase [Chthoniobacter sp.]|nr:amidase [Chthoniobacter sp.]
MRRSPIEVRVISKQRGRLAVRPDPYLMPTAMRQATILQRAALAGLASVVLLSGCSVVPRFWARAPGDHAFIAYWPPVKGDQQLTLAVKDNIDIKGTVTSAGSEYFSRNNPPAAEDAPCLAIARARQVQFVGKTNLSEFALSPSGSNEYFGTPRNPLGGWRKLIPGGSSSGAAVAVANGEADVAFGTDTAGSVRVPAACCGVVGLKTTHGLISIDGVHPIEAAHLDTVGPLGKDIAHTVQGMDLLQTGFAARYAAATAAKPSGSNIRIGRFTLDGTDPKIDQAIDQALALAGFQVVPVRGDFARKWEQAKEDGNSIAAAGAWISDQQFRYKIGVSARTKSAILVGRLSYRTRYRQALARRGEWQNALREVFKDVDFIALPTMQSTPPPIPPNLRIGLLEALVLKLQNTVAVNFAGNPALAMPVPLHHAGVAVTSLQLIGPPRSEAELLNAGRLVEAAVKK